MKDEALDNYYTKIMVGGRFTNELSNASYLVKELKRTRNSMNNFRQRKAELRKEFFETLISLRLNMDALLNHLPHHEASVLKKKIEQIEKYEKNRKKLKKEDKEKKVKKKKVKKKKAKIKKKKEEKKVEAPKPVKKKSIMDDALESEKKELELLKKDLENISRELKKKKK